MSYIDDVFGPAGYLAQRFSGYEPRPGQVALARAVDSAMVNGRHLLAEGPCGTGKSVAYGVPATWHASQGRRVVIATANIALQEQLTTKDLPLLAEILPWSFKHALLKGRNNYWCHDASERAHQQGYFDDLRRGGFLGDDASRAGEQVDALLEWSERTETGDKSELPFVPVSSLWGRVSAGEDECGGDACPDYEDCHFYRARAIAHKADVIVTNYHLLFAHLKVREVTGRNVVLPDYDFLVLDEAHEAADVARDFFGFAVSEGSVRRIVSFARKYIDQMFSLELERLAQRFFHLVAEHARSTAYSTRLRQPGWVEEPGELLAVLGEVAERARDLAEEEGAIAEERQAGKVAFRQVDSCVERIREAVALADPDKVYFVEFYSRGARIVAKQVDVAETLRELMFGTAESVTLASATLAAEGSFRFVRRELGVPDDALEIAVESPFDFAKQALLVVPTCVPAVEAASYPQAMGEALRSVIVDCQGRTLGLFTSNKSLAQAHDYLRNSYLPYTLLKQGELPRTELARLFKEDVHSVLLGTNSFWTGIDVPGEALTGLVIDKLPFPNRSDPVVDVICERDQKWFDNYSKPRAVIMLRQGVGRLIRSQRDVGVVVILDRRLVDKYYKRDFFRSLPPMQRSPDLGDVGRFLRGEPLKREAAPAPSASLLSMFP